MATRLRRLAGAGRAAATGAHGERAVPGTRISASRRGRHRRSMRIHRRALRFLDPEVDGSTSILMGIYGIYIHIYIYT